jgi:cysteine desulfurase
MLANNEIGTIQPIEELVKICKQQQGGNCIFHTDACQAAGALRLDLQKLGVDLLTLNGSKIYGPKGVGLLYLRQGVRLKPLLYGGGQEFQLRPGTENVPAIVGLAKALELIDYERAAEVKRLTELRRYFETEIAKKIPKIAFNGHPSQRLPNNVSATFPDGDGESLLLALDDHGIAAASGSACDSTNQEPSHVLLAIGRSPEEAARTLRFTLGKQTTQADLNYVIVHLADSITDSLT